MNLPLPLAAALLLAPLLVRADVVIVEKVDNAGQTGNITVSVSGDKVRSDISPKISTITDSNSGDITTLMHDQKVFVLISASTSRMMLEQMTRAMQQANSAIAMSSLPQPPKATGTTGKINGFNATEYTFANGPLAANYWMSTDFPNAKDVTDALAKFRKGGLADMTKAFSPDLSSIPGVPVRTEVDFNGQKVVTDLVSATVQKLDPAQFQVPTGYTEMKPNFAPPAQPQ